MCESDPGCEATQRDEFIIEKLKSAVSEIALSRNKLQDENQKLLQELKMYQRQCQVRLCAQLHLQPLLMGGTMQAGQGSAGQPANALSTPVRPPSLSGDRKSVV